MIASSSVLGTDGASSGITLAGKGCLSLEGGAKESRRFFGPPTEFIDPRDVATERTLKLSKLSVLPEFLGVRRLWCFVILK